jgi:hypothetical protein
MIVHGPEYLGLGLIVSLVAAYAVVLGLALAIAAIRRLLQARRHELLSAAPTATQLPSRRV